VGRTALARFDVRCIPGPQMRGTGGTRHLRWGRRRLRALGFVVSPVPKCEGPGAPATCGGADGACAPWGSWYPRSPNARDRGHPPPAGGTRHLRWGRRRLRALGFVVSPVPKCEGPGAPATCGGADGACAPWVRGIPPKRQEQKRRLDGAPDVRVGHTQVNDNESQDMVYRSRRCFEGMRRESPHKGGSR